MIYLVDNKKVNIPVENPPYDKGSEGKVYKIGNYIYKIYYPEMLNENYGSKERHHKYFLTVPTSQIILPDQTIYTTEGDYIGYRTPYISGNKKQKTGITKLPKQEFIKNLQVLESDFDLLSEHYVLAADVSPVNYIFNKRNHTMNVIDPGRYRHHCFDDLTSYKRQNRKQYEHLIELLLYIDFMEYKPVNSKRKILELRHYLNEIRRETDQKESEFWQERLEGFESVDEYAKSLKKYIK